MDWQTVMGWFVILSILAVFLSPVIVILGKEWSRFRARPHLDVMREFEALSRACDAVEVSGDEFIAHAKGRFRGRSFRFECAVHHETSIEHHHQLDLRMKVPQAFQLEIDRQTTFGTFRRWLAPGRAVETGNDDFDRDFSLVSSRREDPEISRFLGDAVLERLRTLFDDGVCQLHFADGWLHVVSRGPFEQLIDSSSLLDLLRPDEGLRYLTVRAARLGVTFDGMKPSAGTGRLPIDHLTIERATVRSLGLQNGSNLSFDALNVNDQTGAPGDSEVYGARIDGGDVRISNSTISLVTGEGTVSGISVDSAKLTGDNLYIGSIVAKTGPAIGIDATKSTVALSGGSKIEGVESQGGDASAIGMRSDTPSGSGSLTLGDLTISAVTLKGSTASASTVAAGVLVTEGSGTFTGNVDVLTITKIHGVGSATVAGIAFYHNGGTLDLATTNISDIKGPATAYGILFRNGSTLRVKFSGIDGVEGNLISGGIDVKQTPPGFSGLLLNVKVNDVGRGLAKTASGVWLETDRGKVVANVSITNVSGTKVYGLAFWNDATIDNLTIGQLSTTSETGGVTGVYATEPPGGATHKITLTLKNPKISDLHGPAPLSGGISGIRVLGWETLLTISGPSCSIENLNGSGVTAIVSQSYLEQTISDCRIAHIQSVYTDQAAVVLESYGSDNQTSFIPVMTVRGLTIDDIGQAGIYVASMWTAVRVERNLIRGWSHRGIEFDGFSTASTMVAENNLVVGHQDPLDLSGIAIAGGNVWVWFNTVDCAPLSVDGVPADVGIQTSDAELTTAIVATWWSTVRPPGSGG